MDTTTIDYDALLASHGISVTFKFVPFSQSRNAKPLPNLDDLSLNWKATISAQKRQGVPSVTIDYQQGIGHASGWKQGMRSTLHNVAIMQQVCETGRAPLPGHDFHVGGVKRAPEPKPADVLHCVLLDSEVLDYPFEQWASEFGYDSDSRKAEATYKACLETAMQLYRLIGPETIRELREAFQDY